MRYENEKCPVCGEIFRENDDIAVCPECGAPHHRKCFIEKGKCAFEEMHGDGYSWIPSDSRREDEFCANNSQAEKKKICPNCGAENEEDALFCRQCRVPFILTEEEQREDFGAVYIDGERVDGGEFADKDNTLTVAEVSLYADKNREYFIKSFLKAKFTKGKQKFNWSAFFLTPYWFFYRKMYGTGFIFAGCEMGLSLIWTTLFIRCFAPAMDFIAGVQSGSVEMTQEIANEYLRLINQCTANHPALSRIVLLFPLLIIALGITAGFLANRIYLEKIKKDAEKIKTISPNREMYKSYLRARGGTAPFMAVILALALYFFMQAVTMIQ